MTAKIMRARPPTTPPAIAPAWEVEEEPWEVRAGAVIVEPGGRTVVRETTTVEVCPLAPVDTSVSCTTVVREVDRDESVNDGVDDVVVVAAFDVTEGVVLVVTAGVVAVVVVVGVETVESMVVMELESLMIVIDEEDDSDEKDDEETVVVVILEKESEEDEEDDDKLVTDKLDTDDAETAVVVAIAYQQRKEKKEAKKKGLHRVSARYYAKQSSPIQTRGFDTQRGACKTRVWSTLTSR
jgi:hypothetical protein